MKKWKIRRLKKQCQELDLNIKLKEEESKEMEDFLKEKLGEHVRRFGLYDKKGNELFTRAYGPLKEKSNETKEKLVNLRKKRNGILAEIEILELK